MTTTERTIPAARNCEDRKIGPESPRSYAPLAGVSRALAQAVREAEASIDATLAREHLVACETCGWPMVTPAGTCLKCDSPLCVECRDLGQGYCAPCLYALDDPWLPEFDEPHEVPS